MRPEGLPGDPAYARSPYAMRSACVVRGTYGAGTPHAWGKCPFRYGSRCSGR